MKQAIITGSTGLLAVPLVRLLHQRGIQVICLGSKTQSKEKIHEIFGFHARYYPLLMENIEILPKLFDEFGVGLTNPCVFYNFAWKGLTNLTDGSFADQLKNAVYSAEAVKIAKKLGCVKFVNIGSIQETFIEYTLNNISDDSNSMQNNYSLCKLAARDMCKITAYLEKVDYVHTRLSIPLDFSLERGTYVAKTLKEIASTGTFKPPNSKQLFDIISTYDAAEYLYIIGFNGKNKHDYYIGCGMPASLEQFFCYFKEVVYGQDPTKASLPVCSSRNQLHFDTSKIKDLTGYKPSFGLEELGRSLRK